MDLDLWNAQTDEMPPEKDRKSNHIKMTYERVSPFLFTGKKKILLSSHELKPKLLKIY